MRASTIVSPRLLTDLTPGFFPSTGTVQRVTTTQSPTGAPVESWSDAAGMTDLACVIAPASASETWGDSETVTLNMHTAVLAGSYAVTTADRFVSGGTTYNITAVQHDSHGTMTRLLLKTVTT